MIMGCNSTLLWSTNHTGLAWTALNANEPWLEYWTAGRPRSSRPFAPRGDQAYDYGCDPAPPATLSLLPARMDRFNVHKHQATYKLLSPTFINTGRPWRHNTMRRNKHVGPSVNILFNNHLIKNVHTQLKTSYFHVFRLWTVCPEVYSFFLPDGFLGWILFLFSMVLNGTDAVLFFVFDMSSTDNLLCCVTVLL